MTDNQTCLCLEAIANLLHQVAGLKDNQSTSSVGYLKTNQTLYFTHQANRKFDEFWGNDGKEAKASGGIKKVRFTHLPIYHYIDEKIAELASSEDAKIAVMSELLGEFLFSVEKVKVVTDVDIGLRTEEHSGFHGEARLARHLLLKIIRTANDNQFVQWSHMEPKMLISDLRKKFGEKYKDKVYMASSQGACSYCANFMDDWGIKYFSKQTQNKNRDNEWRHPVTTTTKGQDFKWPSVLGLLVTVLAFERRKQPKEVL